MKRTISCLVSAAAVVSLVAIPAYATEVAAPKAKATVGTGHANPAQAAAAHGGAAHGGSSLLLAADELKWNDVAGFPGVKTAVLHGDPAKGPAHFFMKLPAGFKADTHFHNADHWVAVVAGTVVVTPEGGAEKRLPQGSGFSFTGKKHHVTKCAEGSDCVMFIDARGPWDVIPVAKK